MAGIGAWGDPLRHPAIEHLVGHEASLEQERAGDAGDMRVAELVVGDGVERASPVFHVDAFHLVAEEGHGLQVPQRSTDGGRGVVRAARRGRRHQGAAEKELRYERLDGRDVEVPDVAVAGELGEIDRRRGDADEISVITPEGALKRLAADIERPNGIQLSPDEKVLYVANTLGENVLAYDVANDGSLGARRDFAKLAGWSKNDSGVWSSGADGLAVDELGRLYVASNAGIEVFSPSGEALGAIALSKKPQNLAFAGVGKKSLYIVGRGAAYHIVTQTAGYTGRAK